MADGELDPQEDDIGADVRAAYEALKDGDAPAPEPAAAPVESAAETDARVRDEKGRFAAKEAAEASQAAETRSAKPPAIQTQEAPAETPIAPPAKWEPDAKAAFMSAPPAIQKQILAQMEQVEKGQQEWQPKSEVFAQLDRVIAPVRQKWAMAGMSEAQGVAALVAAQDILDRNPIEGLAQIARSYGVTAQHLLDALGAGQQGDMGGQPTNDPRVVQLTQRLQALEGTLTQQQQFAQQQEQSAINQQIAAFANDPKNVYFENVKTHMGALLQSGQATDLATAYEMATWARPDIRKLIMAQDRADEAAKEKVKVAAAKAAGGSVVGSPGPGKAAASPTTRHSTNDTDDIRGDVMKALRDARAQA